MGSARTQPLCIVTSVLEKSPIFVGLFHWLRSLWRARGLCVGITMTGHFRIGFLHCQFSLDPVSSENQAESEKIRHWHFQNLDVLNLCTSWSDVFESSSKAQSSNLDVSFATFPSKETYELWALRFRRAFANVTSDGIGCDWPFQV